MLKSPDIGVFGYDYLGKDVTDHFELKKREFVVVDDNEERLQKAEEKGYNTFLADFASNDDLIKLGIGSRIKTIFCLLGEDSQNVFLTISARALDPKLEIVSVCESKESAKKLLVAGANRVIDPYQISARKIVELIEKPAVVELLDNIVFGPHDLNIAEFEIKANSPFIGAKLFELKFNERYDLVLIGIENDDNGGEFMLATRNFNRGLKQGDVLVVIGRSESIERIKSHGL
jgi:voltage-gated potassium channel